MYSATPEVPLHDSEERSSNVKKLHLLLSGLLLSLGLVACGGGSDSPAMVAAADTTLAANPTTTAAVTNIPFAFPQGLSSFGTTSTTTVAFTNTSTTPAFSIATSTGTATGTTTFGSCIFAVTAINGSVGTMKIGDTIVVNPCNVKVGTAGAVANGVAQTRSIALLLGAASSAGASISVGVNAGGQLTLNGNTVGSVTLTPVSG
jgi:hypothetical protein